MVKKCTEKENQIIFFFNLTDDDLGDKEAAIISEALGMNSRITRLDLCCFDFYER